MCYPHKALIYSTLIESRLRLYVQKRTLLSGFVHAMLSPPTTLSSCQGVSYTAESMKVVIQKAFTIRVYSDRSL